MLSTAGAVAAIAVMAIITFLTRALPFLLFRTGGARPQAGPLPGPGFATGHHRHAHRILSPGRVLCRPGGWVPSSCPWRRW